MADKAYQGSRQNSLGMELVAPLGQ